MLNPKKILVIKLRALGDTVIMTASLMRLRESYPKAEIHVVVTEQWKDILNHHPAVDVLWSYQKHRKIAARAKALTRLALKLRKIKFDLVVNLHASPSSATLSFATGAKVRAIHFHGHKDRNRHSTLTIPGKGVVKPAIERDMDTIRSFLPDIPEGTLPRIFLSESEVDRARDRLKDFPGPFLSLSLGASRPTKCWPVESFAEVVRWWLNSKQGTLLAFSTASESERVRELQSLLPEPERLVHFTDPPIRDLCALLSLSKVYLGNDSGPKHLSVAVGTPTVTLFGPEHPLEWHPYPKDQHPYIFIEDLACRKDALPGLPPWCGLHECKIEKHRCMTEVSSQSVIECIQKIL